jgi:SAM-dependent methyltransferase
MSRQPSTPNFDGIAGLYRWMEYLTFGRALERCRTHFLPRLSDRRRALVLGDGDGRFLARMLTANPSLHADAVDTSAAMLYLLGRRAAAASPTGAARLRTHHASALGFATGSTCDLVVTHFFLDCLAQSEVNLLARELARHASPTALWLFSDFRIPGTAMHWPARILIRLLYFAFRLLTGLRTTALPDHAASLTAAGFTLAAQHISLAGILTTELWKLRPAPAPHLVDAIPTHPPAPLHSPHATPTPAPEANLPARPRTRPRAGQPFAPRA